MKVVGVIGLNGSGKDEVVKYLNQRYGVPLISVGDIVREIAAKESIEPTRGNLDEITSRYFKQHGEGYFLKQVVQKIRENKWKTAGISGVRSPQDVSILKDAFKTDFILIYVHISDSRVRYERMRRRGSKRDELSYEDFLKQDKISDAIFHIQEAIRMADFSLANDGTLDDLHREIIKLVIEKGLLG
jgi:dephospho-CoA kinase